MALCSVPVFKGSRGYLSVELSKLETFYSDMVTDDGGDEEYAIKDVLQHINCNDHT